MTADSIVKMSMVKCPSLRNPSMDLAKIWPQFTLGKECPSIQQWSWSAVQFQRKSKKINKGEHEASHSYMRWPGIAVTHFI